MRNKWLLLIPLFLVIVYFLGPHPEAPTYNSVLPIVPRDAINLEKYINLKESAHHLKPDNEARIIWFDDSTKKKTEYSMVYLHGFSASQAEGEPVHRNLAKQFGCNLYLSRLAAHGIDTSEALGNLTVENYWESAKEALSIGRQIGQKVILVGTSTGGSFALMLAAKYPDVHALVLLSPNIAINDPNAWLLNNPWGIQIARTVLHSNYVQAKDQREIYKQYWNSKYRIEAAIQLQEMLETSMNRETFSKVTQPVLTLYYYKDRVHQDSVVKVSAMRTMMEQLATPASLKRFIDVPNAGNHVIGSFIKSRDIETVQADIARFMTEVLHLAPVQSKTGGIIAR
jgi:esterase/lipase